MESRPSFRWFGMGVALEVLVELKWSLKWRILGCLSRRSRFRAKFYTYDAVADTIRARIKVDLFLVALTMRRC